MLTSGIRSALPRVDEARTQDGLIPFIVFKILFMSRSRKKHPVGFYGGCASQKRGKKMCHGAFRSRERIAMRSCDERLLPYRMHEAKDTYDLGGDGKKYFSKTIGQKLFARLLRK